MLKMVVDFRVMEDHCATSPCLNCKPEGRVMYCARKGEWFWVWEVWVFRVGVCVELEVCMVLGCVCGFWGG